jgi:DNA-binding transcriptional MerR regulator
MSGYLLTSGEFASLVATTKETLRHYRSIDLLRPVRVADNGYCYYDATQILDFLLISALRSTGHSLEEIRGYLATPSPAEMRGVLTRALTALEREKREIARKQRLVRNTIARLDLLESRPEAGRCFVEECGQEYYIQTSLRAEGGGGERTGATEGAGATGGAAGGRARGGGAEGGGEVEVVREHLRYCQEQGFGEEFQLTYRIGHAAFLSGDYFDDFSLCSRIPRRVKSRRLHVKPPGLYLKMMRDIRLNDMIDAVEGATTEEDAQLLLDTYLGSYDALKDHAAENGYHVIGDAYETELSVYTGSPTESFSTELSVLVQRA